MINNLKKLLKIGFAALIFAGSLLTPSYGATAASYTNEVQTMYIAYFGRPADPGGITYYTNLMADQNGSYAAILDDFANSPESKALYNQTAVADKLNQVYQYLFARNADAGGSTYWTGLISAGQITLSNAAYIIAYNAQSTDAAILAAKQAASSAFTSHLVTAAQVQAYTTCVEDGRLWMLRIVNNDTAINAIVNVGNTIAGLRVTCPPAVAITTPSSLAIGTVGSHYSQTLKATGGTAPYSWIVSGGSLPPGITLNATGSLNGTATSYGSFKFIVQTTDSLGVVVAKTLNLTVTSALLAALVTDGSFEQGFAQWSVPSTNNGVQYSVVTEAIHGSKAVRVANRVQSTDAPRQNVFSSTLANASGTPVTSRFWIKLDAPGVARCVINLTSDLGGGQSASIKLFLAEQVVRTANVWVEVIGTVTLAWDGTLTSASINFEVSQPAENVYPAFSIDNLRVQRDGDADGLPDVDETVAGALTSDWDDDGLPDAWEARYFKAGQLDPDLADADLDADGDGFTNREEFWAGTDPLDPAAKPGMPSTVGANAKVQALTKYLALLPSLSSNRVVSGQHITGMPSLGGLAGEFDTNVQALFTKTGKWPGILSMQYEGADISIGPVQATLVNPIAIDWAAQGGLVLIKFQPFDPWTLAASGPAGDAHVDLVGLLNPAAGNPANLASNMVANSRWLAWLDQMATGLDQLQQAGVVVLWRPLSEMNNRSHWQSRQPREAWIALWRHMHGYFSNTRGLKNLIWVYEGDATAHTAVPADYYYPGDDVVDLMGHNMYHDDWVLPYDLNAVFRRYPKIYGFPQAGSSSVRDGSWDNLTIINSIRERFPRASLFCAWNDYYIGGNVIQVRSIVSQANAAGLLNDPWIITRDEIK